MKIQRIIRYSVQAINTAHDLCIALDNHQTYRRIEQAKDRAIATFQIIATIASLIGVLVLTTAIALTAQSVTFYRWLRQNAPVWRENALEVIGTIENWVGSAIDIISLYNPFEAIAVVRHFRAIL